MKKHLFTLFAAAMVVSGVLSVGSIVGISDVGAWKCEYHPEQPTCTTTTPVNTTIVQSTTTVPDTIVSIPTTSVPESTTTTTTTVIPPEVSINPPSIERPPAQNIKLAG